VGSIQELVYGLTELVYSLTELVFSVQYRNYSRNNIIFKERIFRRMSTISVGINKKDRETCINRSE
jgi:hypothetical protein